MEGMRVIQADPRPGRKRLMDPSVDYAGFWRRSGAIFLDALWMTALVLPIWAVQVHGGRTTNIIARVPFTYIPIVANVWCLARWGRTPGKWATGIRVRRIDLGTISWREALRRESVTLIFATVELAIGLAALSVTADSDFDAMGWRQRLVLPKDCFPVLARYTGWMSQAWLWSELLVLMLNKKRRALHDYIAGTVVVVEK